MQYEYCFYIEKSVVELSIQSMRNGLKGPDPEGIKLQNLNRLGLQGWEIVQYVPTESRYILKRMIKT